MNELVVLSDQEWYQTLAFTAAARHVRSRSANNHQVHGQPRDPLGADAEGSCAERAFAKWLGVYWEGAARPDRHVGDVADWHVRSTQHLDGYLLVHERDADDAKLVLLTGRAPAFTVRGYHLAGAAKTHPEWYRQLAANYQACWCVPQTALRPIDRAAWWRARLGL
jgi:hypothetical protein